MPGIVPDHKIAPSDSLCLFLTDNNIYRCACKVARNLQSSKPSCQRIFYFNSKRDCYCLAKNPSNGVESVDFPDFSAYQLTEGKSIYIHTGLAQNIILKLLTKRLSLSRYLNDSRTVKIKWCIDTVRERSTTRRGL